MRDDVRRLHIALVSDWYLPHVGGVEYQMRELARELMRRGHTVRIVTATPGPELDEALRVHRIDVPIIHRWGIAWNLQALAPLEALFRRERFDVVHAHGLWSPLAFMAVYMARRLGIATVLTNHSVLGTSGVALFRALERRFGWSRWADAINAVSTLTVAETARASGRPVELLANCISAGDWAVARRPGPVTQIASVLRFSTRKAPDRLVRAIPRILAQLPRYQWPRFVIAGDGVHRARLAQAVRRRGLGAVVEFRGMVPRNQLRALLADSQLFVHPTVKEAFGIVMLEARAAGLPVVAMGQSGARDLVAHGITGLLAGCHDEWADAIVRLIRDHDSRWRMTEAAPRGLQRFELGRVADDHLALYGRVLGAAPTLQAAEVAS
jgi:glycosyltransferase involved in cell wall biosynthesis